MKMNPKDKKAVITTIAVIVIAAVLVVLFGFLRTQFASKLSQKEGEQFEYPGRIFLYGEEHSVENILEKEFELWSAYYGDGMRHLFVELPYYTAEYMNLWMISDDDGILDSLYQDWEGTAMHSREVIDFYKKIKKECPETVFHGTDVGHQYNTTGKRFLEYLESNSLKESDSYRLAQENIEQGKHYYKYSDNVYRENTMVKNFIWEVEGLDGADVMGIYGSAHIGIEAMEYSTGKVPCMANQLYKRYGDALYTEDLTLSTKGSEAYQVDTIVIGEKEYTALYYGEVDLSTLLPDYQCRKFWCIKDAYGDFKDNLATGDVLPYNNYPMKIETGQVFLIEYTKKDGSVITKYYRSDGNVWRGSPVTEEFELD